VREGKQRRKGGSEKGVWAPQSHGSYAQGKSGNFRSTMLQKSKYIQNNKKTYTFIVIKWIIHKNVDMDFLP